MFESKNMNGHSDPTGEHSDLIHQDSVSKKQGEIQTLKNILTEKAQQRSQTFDDSLSPPNTDRQMENVVSPNENQSDQNVFGFDTAENSSSLFVPKPLLRSSKRQSQQISYSARGITCFSPGALSSRSICSKKLKHEKSTMPNEPKLSLAMSLNKHGYVTQSSQKPQQCTKADSYVSNTIQYVQQHISQAMMMSDIGVQSSSVIIDQSEEFANTTYDQPLNLRTAIAFNALRDQKPSTMNKKSPSRVKVPKLLLPNPGPLVKALSQQHADGVKAPQMTKKSSFASTRVANDRRRPLLTNKSATQTFSSMALPISGVRQNQSIKNCNFNSRQVLKTLSSSQLSQSMKSNNEDTTLGSHKINAQRQRMNLVKLSPKMRFKSTTSTSSISTSQQQQKKSTRTSANRKSKNNIFTTSLFSGSGQNKQSLQKLGKNSPNESSSTHGGFSEQQSKHYTLVKEGKKSQNRSGLRNSKGLVQGSKLVSKTHQRLPHSSIFSEHATDGPQDNHSQAQQDICQILDGSDDGQQQLVDSLQLTLKKQSNSVSGVVNYKSGQSGKNFKGQITRMAAKRASISTNSVLVVVPAETSYYKQSQGTQDFRGVVSQMPCRLAGNVKQPNVHMSSCSVNQPSNQRSNFSSRANSLDGLSKSNLTNPQTQKNLSVGQASELGEFGVPGNEYEDHHTYEQDISSQSFTQCGDSFRIPVSAQPSRLSAKGMSNSQQNKSQQAFKAPGTARLPPRKESAKTHQSNGSNYNTVRRIALKPDHVQQRSARDKLSCQAQQPIISVAPYSNSNDTNAYFEDQRPDNSHTMQSYNNLSISWYPKKSNSSGLNLTTQGKGQVHPQVPKLNINQILEDQTAKNEMTVKLPNKQTKTNSCPNQSTNQILEGRKVLQVATKESFTSRDPSQDQYVQNWVSNQSQNVSDGFINDQQANQRAYLTQRVITERQDSSISNLPDHTRMINVSSGRAQLGQPMLNQTQESESEIEVFNINNQVSSTTYETEEEPQDDHTPPLEYFAQKPVSSIKDTEGGKDHKNKNQVSLVRRRESEEQSFESHHSIVVQEYTPLDGNQDENLIVIDAVKNKISNYSQSPSFEMIIQKTKETQCADKEPQRDTNLPSYTETWQENQTFKNGTFMGSPKNTQISQPGVKTVQILESDKSNRVVTEDSLDGKNLTDISVENVQIPLFSELADQIQECTPIDTLFSPILRETTPMQQTRSKKREVEQSDDQNHFQTSLDKIVSPILEKEALQLENQDSSADFIPQENEGTRTLGTHDSAIKVVLGENKNDLNKQSSITFFKRLDQLSQVPKAQSYLHNFASSARQHSKENQKFQFSAGCVKQGQGRPQLEKIAKSCNPFSCLTPQEKQQPWQNLDQPQEVLIKAFPVFGGYVIGSKESLREVTDENKPAFAMPDQPQINRKLFRASQKSQTDDAQSSNGTGMSNQQKNRSTTLKDIMNQRVNSNLTRGASTAKQSLKSSLIENNAQQESTMGPFKQKDSYTASNLDQESQLAFNEEATYNYLEDSKSVVLESRHSGRRNMHKKRRCSPLGQLLAGRSSSKSSRFSAQQSKLRRASLVPSMKINLQNTFAEAQIQRGRSPDLTPNNAALKTSKIDKSSESRMFNNQAQSSVTKQATQQSETEKELLKVKEQMAKLQLKNDQLTKENRELKQVLNHTLQMKLNF